MSAPLSDGAGRRSADEFSVVDTIISVQACPVAAFDASRHLPALADQAATAEDCGPLPAKRTASRAGMLGPSAPGSPVRGSRSSWARQAVYPSPPSGAALSSPECARGAGLLRASALCCAKNRTGHPFMGIRSPLRQLRPLLSRQCVTPGCSAQARGTGWSSEAGHSGWLSGRHLSAEVRGLVSAKMRAQRRLPRASALCCVRNQNGHSCMAIRSPPQSRPLLRRKCVTPGCSTQARGTGSSSEAGHSGLGQRSTPFRRGWRPCLCQSSRPLPSFCETGTVHLVHRRI